MSARITSADLQRLCLEVADGDKQEWLDEREIDLLAIAELSDYVAGALREIAAVEGAQLAFDGVVGWVFQVGFEACEQFRSGAENGHPQREEQP